MKQNKIIQNLIKIIKKLLFTIHYPLLSKGQSVLEYAVVIVCAILALVAMQGYLKRGMQGNLKSAGDSVGSQYEPKKTSSSFTTRSASDTTTDVKVAKNEDGTKLIYTTTVATNSDVSSRNGTETVGAF